MDGTINIVTLGCSKNLVDSEHLAARCAAAGYGVVFDSNSTEARIVVVNTCGFIGDAKQESIDTILDFVAAKERGDIDRLYVMGCLSERYAIGRQAASSTGRVQNLISPELCRGGDKDQCALQIEIPEVDGWFGARGSDEILAVLGTVAGGTEDAARNNNLPPLSRLISTPPHYAYLKISEGCDRRCGFCAIPLIRGGHVSVPMEKLVAEAEELAAQGVRELIVIAQDTTYYGLDLYGERRLAELLRRLARIEDIEWIRLHYAYPAGFPQDVMEVMRDEPKICKYLDIPLQHIADSQLRSMKRGLDSNGTRDLVAQLRAAIPGLALRTTFLVGYPGETEEDFEELLDFVRETRFERLGVFPYSEEEGTYSASKLADDVPDDVKQRRADHIMEIQAGISAANNAARVGRTECVIADRREGGDSAGEGFWVCRSQWDSPEVDTEILVAADAGALSAGDLITVRITGADEYDLMAEPGT